MPEPIGACETCGAHAHRMEQINERCSEMYGGKRCSGAYGSRLNEGDWGLCSACEGRGLIAISVRCQVCGGDGFVDVRNSKPGN
jgi:hypothetical protein